MKKGDVKTGVSKTNNLFLFFSRHFLFCPMKNFGYKTAILNNPAE